MGWRKKKDGQQAGRTRGGFLQKIKKSGRTKTSNTNINKPVAFSLPQDQDHIASSYCDQIQYHDPCGGDVQYDGDRDEEYTTPVVRRRGRRGHKKRSGKARKKSDDYYRHNIPEPPEEYSIAETQNIPEPPEEYSIEETQNSDAIVEPEDPCIGCRMWHYDTLGQIQEEITGTFIDVAESFFQVSTACVIREHELEGMVNTVRTAKIKPNTTRNGHMGMAGWWLDIRDDDNTNFPTLDETRFTDAEDEESILMLPGMVLYGSRCMGDANQFSNVD